MKSGVIAKKIVLLLLLLSAVALCVCGCNDVQTPPDTGSASEQITAGSYTFKLSKFDKCDTWESNAPNIIFNGTEISTTSDGVRINGSVATIKRAGTYVISGILDNGQLIVETGRTDKVQLVFSGVTMTSKSSSCIWIKCADKVSVTLAENTTNRFTDSAVYSDVNVSNEPSACIFSKCDLTINGKGTMIVDALYNNGIASKDDLKIIDGTIVVSAENNAIKGKDSIVVMGGKITVSKSDDALKVSNEVDAAKGYLYIGGGELDLFAYDDAIQSTKAVFIKGGSVQYDCGGQYVNCDNVVEIDDGLLKEKQ